MRVCQSVVGVCKPKLRNFTYGEDFRSIDFNGNGAVQKQIKIRNGLRKLCKQKLRIVTFGQCCKSIDFNRNDALKYVRVCESCANRHWGNASDLLISMLHCNDVHEKCNKKCKQKLHLAHPLSSWNLKWGGFSCAFCKSEVLHSRLWPHVSRTFETDPKTQLSLVCKHLN